MIMNDIQRRLSEFIGQETEYWDFWGAIRIVKGGKRDFEAREVGYIVNKQYQRLGYAYEALSAVIKAFLHNGTHRIYAECDPRNTYSWKLLEKTGMKREAFFHKNIYFHKDENGNPIWKDTYVYAIWNE